MSTLKGIRMPESRITTEREPHQPPAKKTYTPPRLECFGNLRDLTLGASEGFGESTGSGIRKGGPGS